MRFGPCNCALKIQESFWDFNSQHGSSLGSVKVHALNTLCTPGSMWCDSRVFLLARNLATPYLGREPKAKVTTMHLFFVYEWKKMCWIGGSVNIKEKGILIAVCTSPLLDTHRLLNISRPFTEIKWFCFEKK